MALNQVIPFESATGNQFLIQFSDFSANVNIDISVIDVSILLIESKKNCIPLKDLIHITRIIRDYLQANKVVIYYYCDHSVDDIYISEKHQTMLPQEYRSNLFGRLFDLLNIDGFVKDQIIIDDKNNSPHYISLITKEEDKSNLTALGTEVLKMNDK